MRGTIHTGATLSAALLLASSATAQDDIAAREQAAKAVAAEFVKTLGGTLKQQMSEGGPIQAIAICRDIAPAIANDLSLEHGWKVTRVGTRVRNPMMGLPDAWEQAGLKAFQARADNGEKFAEMSYSEVVAEGDVKYFRFMKPLGVKPLCQSCHGPADKIPDAVQTVLDERYPHDRAVGYDVGDLRGAVSIKQPMD